MSASKQEAQEFLRLFKCVVDTGSDVLVPLAKVKLLTSYNGNFEDFLNDKKHQIFHIWQSKKLLCCECPPAGYNFKRTSRMENWIFKKMYNDNGNEDRRHVVKNSGQVVQVCLHKYVTQSIDIAELDISALSFLLRMFAILVPHEISSLETITSYRSMICHAYSTNCYSMMLLNTAWTELEKALVDLSYPSYKGATKKLIKYLRKVDLEKEEIEKFMKIIQGSIEEVKMCLSSNNNAIEKSVSNLKTTVVEESLVLQQCISNESRTMTKTQQVILQEVKSSNAYISGKIGEILHQINRTSFSVKYEQSERLSEDGKERYGLWQLVTPENWSVEEVEQILTKCEDTFKDMPVKIKFVRKGSLVIMTTFSSNVLKGSTAFHSAVKEFLTKMVEVCQIDTNVSCNVDVTLHILNNKEWNGTCMLPYISTDDKVVQTEDTDYEHQIRMKKYWNESTIFDLAFLNSDNQTEIEWSKNIATMLKAKYDITCAIPTQDFLFGYPLKKKLLKYLQKFQAVILTVTKDNFIEYDNYVDKKMSLILVELDYISKIPSKVRNIPYINCTTCEHIWFPQLVDILQTKLPELSRKRIEPIKDEQDEKCKMCKSSSIQTVYHAVGIKNITDFEKQSFVAFCGSLIDEAWILNFLNQKTDFMKPLEIFQWFKMLNSQFMSVTPAKVYVCASPNLQKCPQIDAFVNRLVTNKKIKVYLLKIAQTENPSFLEQLPNCIDATSMDQKELAHKLFWPTAENWDSRMLNMNNDDFIFERSNVQSMEKYESRLPDDDFIFERSNVQSMEMDESSRPEVKIICERFNVQSMEKYESSRPDKSVDETKSLKQSHFSSVIPRRSAPKCIIQ